MNSLSGNEKELFNVSRIACTECTLFWQRNHLFCNYSKQTGDPLVASRLLIAGTIAVSSIQIPVLSVGFVSIITAGFKLERMGVCLNVLLYRFAGATRTRI